MGFHTRYDRELREPLVNNLNVHGQMTGTEDVVHTYDDILLNHRKKEIMPSAAAWMDLVK